MADFATEVLKRADVPASEIVRLLGLAKTRRLARGDVFCRLGQTDHEVGFVENGLLQVYQVTEKGEHVVLDFLVPGMFAVALGSATKNAPSGVSIDALGPAVLQVWPYASRLGAQARHGGWMRFETSLVEEAFVRKQRRYQSLLTLTAEQRHAELMIEFAAVLQLIPQHLVASYLHITPQYLSRLKRRRDN